ncbi:putative polygalacturonate 4-alpha-galacturonosyltransferase [Medicago truncatula]|uniref:Hexosyltransferase n=1 Tax=Medicago truncatula TaxID=3880 RepID=G7ISN0_MEDTR|nr:probable galacturonosyltransferase 4 [Medicago truncatula]AES64612.1 CAZy family GT8 glycosyltransferase [Medicago truncatula]RHN72731.1 putative polygalacturonate 4-alpha-galacturonosyltransferase [Medicago truncatula]
MMGVRNIVLLLLCITVVAPIVLYTDRLGSFESSPSTKQEFIEEVTVLPLSTADSGHLNLLPQETSTVLKEPIGVVYTNEDSINRRNLPRGLQLAKTREHVSARVLSATTKEDQAEKDATIKLVTDEIKQGNQSGEGTLEKADATGENVNGEDAIDVDDNDGKLAKSSHDSTQEPLVKGTMLEQQQTTEISSGTNKRRPETNKQNDQMPSDARVQQLKDQLIQAKVYLSLPVVKSNPHLTRELRLRVKEVSRTLGEATKDSDLPRNAKEKMKAMEQTLLKGKQIQDDCASVVKKLRAMIHSTEEQLHVLKKQTLFLTQLTAKTLPKGLHCLPLRLTTEYYKLNSSQQQFPNQEKLEDPQLYHYAIFSDNILATAVVVNSTVLNAKDASKHVFHIVTDRLNYAAMRMWFLVNSPGKATIQVQNIEDFTWLNASYSPVLKQLASPAMIDYYFKAHKATSDSNLKFRNPKYLSILNHLRFYLPEVFPKLNKVLFLDDDIVVQKDLTGLWSIDLKGNVNGAVETCGESFHRFDRYLNFSNPLIAKNFDPHACGWAYGMNVFDLVQWKRQKITEVYHNWQNLNHDRQLWKLGTLPPGLITFWKRTFPLNKAWHVLGLGYNPNVNQKDIDRAAVMHYNGNMKPWLEISIPKFRGYWTKYVNYNHVYLRECNINP